MNDEPDDIDYLHIDVGSDTTPMEDGALMRNKREVDCSVDSTKSGTYDDIDDFNINEESDPPTMKECGLCEGNTYDSHNNLETDILSWGRSCGILKLAARNSKKVPSKNKDNEPFMERDDDRFPYVYYAFKCSSKCHKGIDCGFNLTYKYLPDIQKISIVSILPLDRNIHKNCNYISPKCSSKFVTMESELSAEEKKYLIEISPDRPCLSRLRSTLNRIFPNRIYDRHLLYRFLQKGLDDYLGSDKESATKFLKYGDQLIRDGGIFEKSVCSGSLRFTSIHLQHMLEKELNATYGQRFVSIDTTFNVTCHDFKFMPYVGVDCLCKNCPLGYSFMDVENAADIVKGFQTLGIGSQGIYVGCDNGTAIICALKELNMFPAHDGWHYHRSGKIASKNIGALKNNFLSDLFKVIYNDFYDEQELDELIKAMMDKYSIDDKMRTFLIGELHLPQISYYCFENYKRNIS